MLNPVVLLPLPAALLLLGILALLLIGAADRPLPAIPPPTPRPRHRLEDATAPYRPIAL